MAAVCGVRLAHGEAAGQELAEHAGRRVAVWPAAVARLGDGIRCRAGRQQGEGEKKRAAGAADMLHPHNYFM